MSSYPLSVPRFPRFYLYPEALNPSLGFRASVAGAMAEALLGGERNWVVTHVPGELDMAPSTVHVLAASVDPKLTSLLIRELHTRSPLTTLPHVKRVQRTVNEAGVQLSIILCTINGELQGSADAEVPANLLEVVEKYSLQPYVVKVPEQAASTREEWEAQCLLWPTSYHPNACTRGCRLEVSDDEAAVIRKFMEAAIHQARLAHSSGQPANGAVIVDPFLGRVIAWGGDETTPPTYQFFRHCISNESEKSQASMLGRNEKIKDRLEDILQSEEWSPLGISQRMRQTARGRGDEAVTWHPLRHAVMAAIDMAAERDHLLFSSDVGGGVPPCKEQGTEGEGGLCHMGTVAKRPRTTKLLVEEKEEGSGGGGTDILTLGLPRPYLCTGFDAYVTREPCAMCAMALVHQRVRRVIYGIPNAFVGALGSRYRLHGQRSLNHHYTVFQISILEEELTRPL